MATAKGRASKVKAKKKFGTRTKPKAAATARKHATHHAMKAPHAPPTHPARRPRAGTVRIQLRWLAHARSGDKGDTANVGLIAL